MGDGPYGTFQRYAPLGVRPLAGPAHTTVQITYQPLLTTIDATPRDPLTMLPKDTFGPGEACRIDGYLYENGIVLPLRSVVCAYTDPATGTFYLMGTATTDSLGHYQIDFIPSDDLPGPGTYPLDVDFVGD